MPTRERNGSRKALPVGRKVAQKGWLPEPQEPGSDSWLCPSLAVISGKWNEADRSLCFGARCRVQTPFPSDCDVNLGLCLTMLSLGS